MSFVCRMFIHLWQYLQHSFINIIIIATVEHAVHVLYYTIYPHW